MLKKISEEIKTVINNFSTADNLIFNNKIIKIDGNNFESINKKENQTIAFIDGGQAEIITTGNFCLSFIRIFAQVFQNNQKLNTSKNEFYLFTRAKYQNNDLFYESKIFSLNEKIIDEDDLLISSTDSSIQTGNERAPINKVTNMARRFAELKMSQLIKADHIVLDGTLEPTFKNEEKYLPNNISVLAKSSSLFTTSGNSPIVLLNKLGPQGCWSYFVENKTFFVKLNEKAKHVFRFEGKKETIAYLIENSKDALFLGYPYGLILADKMARVSNTEKNSLRMNFLLRKENKEIIDYLNTSNAHEILDNLG